MSPESFDDLYRENEGRVRAYITRMIGNADEAEDLTQETFIRARAGLDTFRGESSASTWLFSIATNICLDFLKSVGRRRLQVTPPEVLAEIAASDEESLRFSSDLLLDRDAMGDCVRRLMDELPADQRTALLLHDIEEMTNPEVAEEMGCSVANAKIRVHRARKRLRAVLDSRRTASSAATCRASLSASRNRPAIRPAGPPAAKFFPSPKKNSAECIPFSSPLVSISREENLPKKAPTTAAPGHHSEKEETG